MAQTKTNEPLAVRMRPTGLDDVAGQTHLLGPGSPLRLLAQGQMATSVILYGPPGVGKSTLARVIAGSTQRAFVELSATSAGVKDVRAVLERARREPDGVVLFLDEIHRFSKSQQDSLLPAVEDGTITLIGATTENPSFSVIAPLLSRSLVLTLRVLEDPDIEAVVEKALTDERGLAGAVTLSDQARGDLVRLAGGDARRALTYLEQAAATTVADGRGQVTEQDVAAVADVALTRYDKDGDQHYDVVSAFIKSMRGSDPDAALHWMARMLQAGEDPRFVARRLVVHASEDVGMAAPHVLGIAVAAAQAVQLVGLPEARINLAQAVVAIATAPKSPSVIRAVDAAMADVAAGLTGEVPLHLRDAHYPGAKALGHGQGYLYPHDHPYGVVAQDYLPENLRGRRYYEPTTNGNERGVAASMAAVRGLMGRDQD